MPIRQKAGPYSDQRVEIHSEGRIVSKVLDMAQDGSSANNGGAVTLKGANLGTLLLNTSGHDIGDLTSGGTGNDVVLTRITPTPWQSWQVANFGANSNKSAHLRRFLRLEVTRP